MTVPIGAAELPAALAERGTSDCVLDLACASDGERATLRRLEGRLNALFRGDSRMLTMAEGDALVRENLRERRQPRGGPKKE